MNENPWPRRQARRAVLLVLVAAAGCGRSGYPLDSLSLGSRLAVTGRISDHSLVYRFPRHPRQGTLKDLFNHIYFEGDTVCFSFVLSPAVDASTVRVDFIDPVSGKAFAAERLDVAGRRVFGFSLVGSLLERFFETRLAGKTVASEWNGRSVGFAVRISVVHNGEKIIREMPSVFRVEL